MSPSPDSALRSILQGCQNLHSIAGEEQPEIQPFLSQIEHAGAEISRVLKKRTGNIFTPSILATVLGGKRLLVVEDNTINQRVIFAMLQKAELADLQLCENGQEALALLETTDFDLVLMDINMPVMDGETATREIRRRGYDLPIIALTANPPEKRQRYLDAGMNGYLSKPVTVEGLTREISQVLTRKGPTSDEKEWADKEAEPPDSAEPALNYDQFAQLFGHDEQLCAEVAEEFLAQAVEEIERIGRAWKALDYRALEDSFHKLGGSAFNLQAKRLGGLCRKGEELSATLACSTQLAEVMEEVILAYAQLREVLRKKMPSGSFPTPGTRA